jgi:hypothetical protein
MQRSGMKLNEFDVGNLSAGSICASHTVTGGHVGIRRVLKNST